MKHWPTKPLGKFCRTGSGGTPSRSKPEYYAAGTVPWVKSGELRDSIILDTAEKISEVATRETNARPVPKNAVLVAMYGATVGKTSILGIEATTNQAVCHIIPDDQTANFRFVWYAVRSCLDQLLSKRVGGAQPNISQGIIRDTVIPVPPLAEQERIVKLLDEADELRKLRAQADRHTATLIPSLFHEMFGNNTKKPPARVRLDQIAEVVSGVAKGRKFNGRQPVEVSYPRVANVQAGHLDLSEIRTIQALPEEVEELALRKGDVLLTEGGDFDKLGRGAMLDQDLPNCIHQNHVFRVRVEQSKLNPVYFAKFLLTGEARGYFLGCAKRTTNLASINMTQLRALPVLLPPLPLQKEFAARVSEIRAVQAEQSASHRRLDDLFQSMLHRAFRGKL